MQKLRRLNFFDKHVVKQEKADVHLGVQRLNVVCAHGGSHSIWLGIRGGELYRLDRHFSLSVAIQAFTNELIDVRVVDQKQMLVALGIDNIGRGENNARETRYKVYDLRREQEEFPVPLMMSHRVFLPRAAEHRVLCFDASSALSLVAFGLEKGIVHLFRSSGGRDLSQDRPKPEVLNDDGDQPVTGVHFLEQNGRSVLFVCNMVSVRSWAISDRDGEEVRQLNVDTSGGAPELCACAFPTISALFVAKGDAIFAYDPDEGNMSAVPLEGDKMILTQFKSYFVAVTCEGGLSAPARGSVAASPSVMPKQNVIVCLAYPHMRFIAYQGQFTDVTHVFSGLGSIFVLSRGGADSNTVLFELCEKDLSEQLDILVKKRMFEWAAEIALRSNASSENIADIYRQHGDALFEKRAYDQALAVYTKTVDLGLPLEPSYIVERYLDAQRIGHVAQYLKRLHECNMAEREHTALLLKCYTKLKDFSTLEEFLETTPVSQYDPSTAIGVLEAAGYYGLAGAIAQKVNQHDDWVRISLEHFKIYPQTVNFLRSLPRPEASKILLDYGRVLMRHAPKETIELVQELCGLSSGNVPCEPPQDGPHVDDFLPIFVDDLAQLEGFLRGILLAPGGCMLPQAEAERLFPTLLELLVRSYQQLMEVQESAPAAAEVPAAERAASKPADEPRVRALHDEIMKLIRQYSSKQALASTLMLCQTYGFVDGFFHAAEGLGRYQLLMNWCFEQRDAKRLLQVCKENGAYDQSLWVQALSFLAVDESDPMEEIGEVLRHIEESDLMPLLMVIQTLQQNPRIGVDAVRSYMQGQFRRLSESVDTSRGKARQDRQEIERMQQEIVALRTRAQEFQNTKCFQCGLTLEVPAVHFFCAHSYHSYCMPADGRCPKCSSEALPKITLKEQREAQARNTEDFFKYLQGGGGEGGVQAMGEWCKFGAFDAGLVAAREEDGDF
mmetsp:Transcript_806/g.1205  ORF Transcript_806/g.1205 Transcript_806/m.1205 type:complete len:952 (-) Transcript_806:33-2888(-)